MATGQVGFKDQKKVKRVYVAKRENPIVNRLNKTKVEKFPDFRQEKEDRARELRKKDRSVIAERVRQPRSQAQKDTDINTVIYRQRKKLALQEREKNWHTRETTLTMTGTRRSRSWPLATKTAIRIGRTILCEGSDSPEITFRHNTRAVSPRSGHTRAQLRSRYNALRKQPSENVSEELVSHRLLRRNVDHKDETSNEHFVRTHDHFWQEAAELRDTLIPGCFSRTRPGFPVHHVQPLVDFSSKRKPAVRAALDLVERIRSMRLSYFRISLNRNTYPDENFACLPSSTSLFK